MNMRYNLPPQDPTKFGPGVSYNARGERIDTKAELSDNRPRIARVIGENAIENSVQVDSRPHIWREAAEADISVLEPSVADKPAVQGDTYAGEASRQMDLERAQVILIQRAAEEAGMSVDQYLAARHRRNQQIMTQNKRSR